MKQHLSVAGAGEQRKLRVAVVLDHEAGILDATLAAHPLQIALPALAVGRVGEHEVKLPCRERIVGEGGMLRATHDVVGGIALALQQQIRFADRIGFGIDLLAIEVGGHLLAVLSSKLLQFLFRHGEHAAGAAGAVVKQIGAGVDLICHRQEDQLRHQLHGVTGRPVLAGLFVVLLVEAAHQFLKQRAHGVVVEAAGAEIDVWREELADQGAERIGFREPWDLVAELEILEDVLHIGREAIEVGLEVGLELLLAGARLQIAQREG